MYKLIEQYDPEEVHYFHEECTGLRAIVVIDDTTLGPATGGTRFFHYSSFLEALEDALKLAKAMTYKCAAADMNFGGGKAVIIGDPQRDKTPELLREYGRRIAGFNGRFTTGQDLGITAEDLKYIGEETRYLAGSEGGVGDLSVVAAQGLIYGMKACAKALFSKDSLKNLKIAVQGAGQVGHQLIKKLSAEGAEVFVSDVNPRALERVTKEFKAKAVNPEDIYEVECDIFSPCAIGGILNDQTIPRLQCAAVSGSANNQLKEPRHGEMLHELGILYAPDYVVNAGGLIAGVQELTGGSLEKALAETEKIYDRLSEIIARSKKEGISTAKAADLLVEERLRQAKLKNSSQVGTLAS